MLLNRVGRHKTERNDVGGLSNTHRVSGVIVEAAAASAACVMRKRNIHDRVQTCNSIKRELVIDVSRT